MQVDFKRIHRELGVTMIYVTHDQTVAMTMSDRIAVFNQGVIEQIGTPDDVYHRPETSFVASSVGDSNIFEGVVASSGEGLVEVRGLGPVQTARRDLAAGARVSILMRQEIFRVKARMEGPPGSTREILVEDAMNYGDSRLVLGRAGGVPIRTRVPSLDGGSIVGGQRCALERSPDHVHVIG